MQSVMVAFIKTSPVGHQRCEYWLGSPHPIRKELVCHHAKNDLHTTTNIVPDATTPEEYVGGTADWRTDLYASRGTLLTHRESIELFRALGAKFTPELKQPVAHRCAGQAGRRDWRILGLARHHDLLCTLHETGASPPNVKPWMRALHSAGAHSLAAEDQRFLSRRFFSAFLWWLINRRFLFTWRSESLFLFSA